MTGIVTGKIWNGEGYPFNKKRTLKLFAEILAKQLAWSTSVFSLIAISLFNSAKGDFITFDNIVGANGGVFSSHQESGFTVTATTGNWQVSRSSPAGGNPQPSIFSRSIDGQISITGSQTFNLLSFQTNDGSISSGISTATYSIQGFLNNTLVMSGGGTVSPNWEVNSSPNSLQSLDRVVISFNLGQTTGYGIDNIEVKAVPEPSSIWFVMSTVACVSWLRFRKKRTFP